MVGRETEGCRCVGKVSEGDLVRNGGSEVRGGKEVGSEKSQSVSQSDAFG